MPASSATATLETLEGRTLYSTVALDPAFKPVIPAELASTPGFAVNGAVLHDGRLLVVGNIGDGDQAHNVYVLYNPDGSLSKSFGHGGYAIQSTKRSQKLGIPSAVYALPDDNVLIQYNDGLRRLTPAGLLDPTYGTNGVLKAMMFNALPQADGTLLGIDSFSGSGVQMRRLDAHGNPISLSSVQPLYGYTQILSDGRVVNNLQTGDGDSADYKVSLYTSKLQPTKTFGGTGTVDITAITDNWFATHKPWYGSDGKTLSHVYFYGGDVVATRDGGVVIDGEVFASAHKPSAANIRAGKQVLTAMHFRLSAAGKLIAVNGDDNRTGYTFANGLTSYSGIYHFGHGQDVAFTPPGAGGNINKSIHTAAGDYFIGENYSSKPGALSYFMVGRTLSPAATISGTLFNDRNHNGVFNTGETINAGRTVFIDSNNNGVLDSDEESAVTDANGRYTFTDLGSGSYHIRRVLPKGYKVTSSLAAVTVAAGAKKTFNIGSVTA